VTVVEIGMPSDSDRDAIAGVVERAFGQRDEATLVERLVGDGGMVLEMIAKRDARIVGHVLFSRLLVEDTASSFAAVALAPLSIEPAFQRAGIGTTLVQAAHRALRDSGEQLSVVVGDPAYYGRFGYVRERAALFESDYQCDAMQALAWGEAPSRGRLVYAPAFGAL
jgi:putative acetyltransferase